MTRRDFLMLLLREGEDGELAVEWTERGTIAAAYVGIDPVPPVAVWHELRAMTVREIQPRLTGAGLARYHLTPEARDSLRMALRGAAQPPQEPE